MGIEDQLNSFERKEQADFSDLVIYTTTMYKDDEVSKVRQKLAENLLENTAKLGVKCVVVDGGSNEEFINFAKSFPNVEVSVERTQGMGESRRFGLDRAMTHSEASYFLWIEPEKYDLVVEKDLLNMVNELRENKSDIVVPRRKSKETLPDFQAWIESRANKRAMEIAGVSKEDVQEVWDLWFGPKMFNREGAKYFQEYQGKLDKWDSIIKPVVQAYQDGKKIASVDVDYKYDLSQKVSEENDRGMKQKRIYQYTKILEELGDEFWQEKLEK